MFEIYASVRGSSSTSKEALEQPDPNFLVWARISAFDEWQMHSSIPSSWHAVTWFVVAHYLRKDLLLEKQYFVVSIYTFLLAEISYIGKEGGICSVQSIALFLTRSGKEEMEKSLGTSLWSATKSKGQGEGTKTLKYIWWFLFWSDFLNLSCSFGLNIYFFLINEIAESTHFTWKIAWDIMSEHFCVSYLSFKYICKVSYIIFS